MKYDCRPPSGQNLKWSVTASHSKKFELFFRFRLTEPSIYDMIYLPSRLGRMP